MKFAVRGPVSRGPASNFADVPGQIKLQQGAKGAKWVAPGRLLFPTDSRRREAEWQSRICLGRSLRYHWPASPSSKWTTVTWAQL